MPTDLFPAPAPSTPTKKKRNIYYSLVNQGVVTDEYSDPCVLDLEDLWCCREVYIRVPPNPASIPLVSNKLIEKKGLGERKEENIV